MDFALAADECFSHVYVPSRALLACKIVFNIGTNEKFAGIQQDFTLGCLRATELFVMSCHPRLRRNA